MGKQEHAGYANEGFACSHSGYQRGLVRTQAQVGQLRRLKPERLMEHNERLFRAAYAMSGSREDAEDLVQETYERVLRRPRFLRRDDDLRYLLRILRNVYWAHSRSAAQRRSRPAPPEDLEWIADERAEPENVLESQAAYAAIAELSEPLQSTIVAVDVMGLSYAEAARSLRTRIGTVMSRLYRARAQVAATLEGS
jgi:RNA polymerase sigma-70 factor (ECF subfamily)